MLKVSLDSAAARLAGSDFTLHRSAIAGSLLIAGAGATGAALAQPVPFDARTGGALVGDLSLDKLYLTVDRNDDGDADEPGEVSVYFDETNASGLPGPFASPFTLFPSVTGRTYLGDGETDSVYWLRDVNGDGDSLDADEAGVWFSAPGNAGGFQLPTPNGLFQLADGSVFIVNAGTSSVPSDAVYRTIDLNDDGDAEDEGEAEIWFDMQSLVPDSSAFEIVFIGSVAYIADTVGGQPDTVWRAEDVNRNGHIDADEFHAFIDDNNSYGVAVGFAIETDGESVYLIENLSSGAQDITRLTDLDQSGDMNSPDEVAFIWSESLIPDPAIELGSVFTIAFGPDRELMVGSGGGDEADNLFRLVDLNHDDDYLDADETIVWARSGGGSGVFVDNPRSIGYLMPGVGRVTLFAPEPGIAGRINEFTAAGGMPGEIVYFVYGLNSGTTSVPGCPGVVVDLRSPRIAGSMATGATGYARFQSFVPAIASGRTILIQAVARSTCRVSGVVAHRFE